MSEIVWKIEDQDGPRKQLVSAPTHAAMVSGLEKIGFVSCIAPESRHLYVTDFMTARSEDGRFFSAMEYVPQPCRPVPVEDAPHVDEWPNAESTGEPTP